MNDVGFAEIALRCTVSELGTFPPACATRSNVIPVEITLTQRPTTHTRERSERSLHKLCTCGATTSVSEHEHILWRKEGVCAQICRKELEVLSEHTVSIEVEEARECACE